MDIVEYAAICIRDALAAQQAKLTLDPKYPPDEPLDDGDFDDDE